MNSFWWAGVVAVLIVLLLFLLSWLDQRSKSTHELHQWRFLVLLKPYHRKYGEMWDSRFVYDYMRERKLADDLSVEEEIELEQYATLIDDYNEFMEYA